MSSLSLSTPNSQNSVLNSDNQSRLHRWIGVFEIFGLFLAVILGWTMPSSFSNSWQAWTVIWILACAVVHLWLRYLAGDRDLLSPDKLFIGAYLYFHFDYLIPYLFGLADYSDQVFAFSTYANLTTYLISLCLFVFLMGYNLIHRVSNERSLANQKQLFLKLDGKSLFVGKTMILVGFLFFTIFIFQVGLSTLLTRSYGFSLFYSGEYNYSFFSQGKSIMAVGIIFFMLDLFRPKPFNSDRNFFNFILLAVVAIYVIAILFLFTVRSWLLLDVFMPGLLIYHYFRRRISVKSLFIALFAFLVFSVVLEIARTSNTRTLSGFVDQFQQNRASKQYELGGLISTQWRTFKNVNKSLALIEAEDRWFYGSTLLGGFFDSVPFAGKYLNKGWYESPSVWLARNLEPWYYLNHEGIGFSLPAEMYINFGLFGSALVFLCLGCYCARIYTRSTSLVGVILYVTFLPNFLFAIRQTVSSFMRPVIIAFLVIFVVQFLCHVLRGKQ